MKIEAQTTQALDMYKQNANVNSKNKNEMAKSESLEEIVNDSATRVTLSMNAQTILFEINTKNNSKGGAIAQGGLFSQDNLKAEQKKSFRFSWGKETLDGMSLKNIGYEGKPILDLTVDEAKELVGEDGFGITQTSNRVANFVFNFAGDDLEKLQKEEMVLFKVLKKPINFWWKFTRNFI